ncbi:MAG: MATE family efflux transporter, partial [Clostridia bacterium]
MPRMMTPEQKLIYMTETPLARLVCTLAIPTIISMLISSFYNMADTYFVGLIGSVSATAAVGVAFPLMSVMQAVGFMFGHGSGNHMARALGAGETADAERMSATGLVSAFICGVIIMIAGAAAARPLSLLLGATPTIAPYAEQYILYLMPGTPFLVAGLVLNNQLRFQGSAFYSMIGITSGALLNVVLDPLLIFGLQMGVAGAALATSLSQVVSFGLLLAGTRRGGNIRLRLRCFTPTLANFREIFRGGVPSL